MRKLALLAATALVAAPLALMAPAAHADRTNGNDYWVRVINNTHRVISEIYATNRDNDDWGVDLIWNYRLPYIGAYSSQWIDMDDFSGYCMYDFYAVATDGTYWELWNRNVCEMNSWTLNY